MSASRKPAGPPPSAGVLARYAQAYARELADLRDRFGNLLLARGKRFDEDPVGHLGDHGRLRIHRRPAITVFQRVSERYIVPGLMAAITRLANSPALPWCQRHTTTRS